MRFSSGCARGVTLVGVAPPGIVSLKSVPVSAGGHQIVALLLTGRTKGLAKVTVRRAHGGTSVVEVRVSS